MYNKILLTNILRLIEELGINKKELSERSGVSTSFMSDLTHDKANPSLRIIEAIAEALETPLPMLLDSSDMSTADLEALTNRKLKHLPKGFVWKGGVLSEFEAYQVEQWDKKNREFLLKNKSKK